MKKLFAYAAVLAVLVVSGCVSTQARRIERDPGLFASFPAEVQAKVRTGDVDIGFTRDMARMALGNPDHIRTRKTDAGQGEVWIYTRANTISHYEPMDTGYWYRDRNGHMRRSYETHWVEHSFTEEYPTMRLEFDDGKIKAVERLKP
ncbi:MAG: hypothetical protein WCO77_03565 [bacterium]